MPNYIEVSYKLSNPSIQKVSMILSLEIQSQVLEGLEKHFPDALDDASRTITELGDLLVEFFLSREEAEILKNAFIVAFFNPDFAILN